MRKRAQKTSYFVLISLPRRKEGSKPSMNLEEMGLRMNKQNKYKMKQNR